MGCPPASLVYLPFEGDRKAHASNDQKLGLYIYCPEKYFDIPRDTLSHGVYYWDTVCLGFDSMEWQELHIRRPGSLRTRIPRSFWNELGFALS